MNLTELTRAKAIIKSLKLMYSCKPGEVLLYETGMLSLPLREKRCISISRSINLTYWIGI